MMKEDRKDDVIIHME